MTPLLTWLAVNARMLLAAGVFVGILLPDLAALLNPLVTPAVIGTLTGALLRLDWRQLLARVRRPWVALAVCVWQLVATPLLVWLAVVALGLADPLGLALILQAAAPPIGSAAVFVMFIGLEASLALLATVLSTLLLPLTLTLLVAALALTLPAAQLQVDLLAFFVRVTLLVLAPFAIAGLLRRVLGEARLHRHDNLLAALNVLLLVLFAIGVMKGVTDRLLAEPWFIGRLLGASCVMALLLHAAGYWVLRRAGRSAAVSAAVCSGNRNMGLMLAVTAGTAGPTFALYVGVAQIPMYFAPLVIAALLRRLKVE